MTATLALGQGRGKIAGHVFDADTKEPLVGATVLLAGTAMGTATDFDGAFTLLNIQPGRYTLVANMIGYRRVELRDVQVNIDLTATVELRLPASTVEMDAVIVEAKAPTIVKDRTESFTNMSAREIEKAPVEGLRNVMEMNAAVQRSASGNLSIRGSGAYEVNFMIDGVSQMTSSTGVPGFSAGLGDKANNSWKYDYNPLGVQQMQVISGGFSAEYGNAQAGIVKVVSKEGGEKIRGDFRMEYRPPGQYHFGNYLYDPNTSPEWIKWGSYDAWKNNPAFDSTNLVKVYGSSPDSVEVWRQLMYKQWVINHTPGAENQLGAYDYRDLAYKRYLFGFGGPLGPDAQSLRFYLAGELRYSPTRVPTVEQIQTYENYTLTLTYLPVPTQKLKATGMYQHYRGGIYSGSEDIRWAGRDGSYKYYLTTDSPRDEFTTTQTLAWTNTISSSTFFETQVVHQYENYILLVEPVPQRASNWRDNFQKGVWYIPTGPWDEGFRTVYSFTTFNQQDLRTDLYSISANLTSQLTPSYQLKAGFQAQSWNMHNSAVHSSFAANAFITREGFAEYYHAYPWYVAAYVQNKLEYEGMVANIGVRYDAFNLNTDIPADRFNPLYFAEGSSKIGDSRTTRPETQVRLSPRLGLSFPIGEATAFRLQYGHFVSMPVFSQAYTRTNNYGWASYGNSGLEPKKTINYEIGIQQSLGGSHRLDAVAYYNDRENQIGVLRIRALTAASGNKYYTTYANNQFGATRGIDLSVERVNPQRWGYRLSYSFSRTSGGSFGVAQLYSDDPADPRNQKDPFEPTEFLGSDDRTHTFRTFISHSLNAQEGGELFGFFPFQNTTVSMTYSAQTGSPFSYVPTYDPTFDAYRKGQVLNNRRYPLEAKFDLNITKNVSVAGISLLFGMRVNNLFNNKWLTPGIGVVDWIERNVTSDNPADNPNRDDYKFRFYQTYRNVPREIYFTLGAGF